MSPPPIFTIRATSTGTFSITRLSDNAHYTLPPEIVSLTLDFAILTPPGPWRSLGGHSPRRAIHVTASARQWTYREDRLAFNQPLFHTGGFLAQAAVRAFLLSHRFVVDDAEALDWLKGWTRARSCGGLRLEEMVASLAVADWREDGRMVGFLNGCANLRDLYVVLFTGYPALVLGESWAPVTSGAPSRFTVICDPEAAKQDRLEWVKRDFGLQYLDPGKLGLLRDLTVSVYDGDPTTSEYLSAEVTGWLRESFGLGDKPAGRTTAARLVELEQEVEQQQPVTGLLTVRN